MPPSGDLPDPGMEPLSPALQMDSLATEPSGKPFIGIKEAYNEEALNPL